MANDPRPIPQSMMEEFLDLQRAQKKANAEAKAAKDKLDAHKAKLIKMWKEDGRRGARGKYTLEVIDTTASAPSWKNECLALAEKLGEDLERFESDVNEAYKKDKVEVKVW